MARHEEFHAWRDAGLVRVLVVALFVLPLGLILGLGLEITTSPWYVVALSVGLPLLVAVGFLFGGMRITVDDEAFHIRVWPFVHRVIPVREVRQVAIVSLRPRRLPRPGPGLYTLHGKQGVRIEAAGTTLVVGSYEPEQLAEALRAPADP